MKFEMKNRLKPCAAISAVIMVIALVMTMMGMGMNLGIDFTGGTLMTYNMGQQFNPADVSAALAACGVGDAQIAATGEEKLISIQSMIDGIAPCLLPSLYVGLMFYLIRVKKWKTIKLIIFTMILGIALSILGVLG